MRPMKKLGLGIGVVEISNVAKISKVRYLSLVFETFGPFMIRVLLEAQEVAI